MRRIVGIGLLVAMAVVLVPADVSGQDACERCVDEVCIDATTQLECFPPYGLPKGEAVEQAEVPGAESAVVPQADIPFLEKGEWDNGPFDGVNALFSSVAYGWETRTADDFVVPECPDMALVEISSATAQLVVFPGVSQAELEIREDAGGQPGALVVDGKVSATYTVEQITFFGLPIWEFKWSFTPKLELAPGTYWITAAAVDELAYWATSDGTPDGVGTSEVYFRSTLFGYPNWVPGTVAFGEPFQVAFTIQGVCPTAPVPVGGVAVGGIELTAPDGGLPARMVEPVLPSEGLLPPTIVLVFGLAVVAVLIGSARMRRRA